MQSSLPLVCLSVCFFELGKKDQVACFQAAALDANVVTVVSPECLFSILKDLHLKKKKKEELCFFVLLFDVRSKVSKLSKRVLSICVSLFLTPTTLSCDFP